MKYLKLFLLLLIVWVFLSGDFEFLPFVPGVISIILFVFLFHRYEAITTKIESHIKFFGFLLYLPWIFKEIIKANIQVATSILKSDVKPHFIEVKNNLKTEQGAVLVANSITATPGTITISVKKAKFIVHALTNDTAQGALDLGINEKIKFIEKD